MKSRKPHPASVKKNLELLPYDVTEAIAKITHPKKRAFLACYYASNGNATKASKAALIHRRTFYDWMAHDPVFKDLIDNQLQELLDEASGKLINRALNDKQATAELIFFLKTRHPDYRPMKETIGVQQGDVKLILTRG